MANDNDLFPDLRRDDTVNYAVRLYKAALIGDWKDAEKIHTEYPSCFKEKLTKQGDTALHIAAVAKQAQFVKQLVSITTCSKDLCQESNIGNTAHSFAASSGVVAIAKTMVNANSELPFIANKKDMLPVHMAALLGHRDMVQYLLHLHTLTKLPKSGLSSKALTTLFLSLINTDLYDIALRILEGCTDLAIQRDEGTNETALHVLARKSQRLSENRQRLWRTCFHRCLGSACRYISCINENALKTKLDLVKELWILVLKEANISDLMNSPWRLLFVAVEVGNVEFVTTLIDNYPDLIWKLDEKYRSIFHVAVQFRQEAIFRLIFEIGGIKDLLLPYKNQDTDDNILHLAAQLPSSDRLNCVPGAALQMQRELLWFEAVEKIVQPQLPELKNKKGQTAKALFTEQHKELRKEGEEWLRKTAGSCSVVATLIAGVVFGAALKIPKSQGVWQWIFVISDSLSLISSTASILVFLSIMTSRYAEKDFLRSLPRKLMAGLALLFFSIATMMIAFTATFDIVFKHGNLWILVAVLAFIIICVFVWLEFPLLLEVYYSSIGCNSIFKSRHQLFPSHSRVVPSWYRAMFAEPIEERTRG